MDAGVLFFKSVFDGGDVSFMEIDLSDEKDVVLGVCRGTRSFVFRLTHFVRSNGGTEFGGLKLKMGDEIVSGAPFCMAIGGYGTRLYKHM
jgi:hypothetical protein